MIRTLLSLILHFTSHIIEEVPPLLIVTVLLVRIRSARVRARSKANINLVRQGAIQIHIPRRIIEGVAVPQQTISWREWSSTNTTTNAAC